MSVSLVGKVMVGLQTKILLRLDSWRISVFSIKLDFHVYYLFLTSLRCCSHETFG